MGVGRVRGERPARLLSVAQISGAGRTIEQLFSSGREYDAILLYANALCAFA